MTPAAAVTGNEVILFYSAGDTEIDVTDIVTTGHLEVLPGIAYDKHNERLWIHGKLFHKYTRIDTEAARWFIKIEWFSTEAYGKQQQDYAEYLRYIKRNAKQRERAVQRPTYHLVKPAMVTITGGLQV